MQTLDNAGYTPGKDLFAATYDWRMDLGPKDGTIDGSIDGLSGANITDPTLQYGVDYLGYWLKKAVEQWKADHPSDPAPDKVDIIAHSTGGLLARTYIQSEAYGDSVTFDFGVGNLPTIENLVLVGVPNRGASGAWNPLHGNFSADMPTRLVLSKLLNQSYQDVLAGASIAGADHVISLASLPSVTPGDAAAEAARQAEFGREYAPTVISLLPTYDFFKTSDAAVPVDQNSNLTTDVDSNFTVLDLNDGLDFDYQLGAIPAGRDPSRFATQVSQVSVLYTDGQKTPTFIVQQTGPSGLVSEVLPFTDLLGDRPGARKPGSRKGRSRTAATARCPPRRSSASSPTTAGSSCAASTPTPRRKANRLTTPACSRAAPGSLPSSKSWALTPRA